MTAKDARTFVMEKMPQARYMNLGGCHCIDDHYNDRYLSHAAASREVAWKEAARFLNHRSHKSDPKRAG